MEAVKRGYQENRRILIDGLPQGRPRPISCPPTARSISTPTSRDFTVRQFRLRQAHAGRGACRGHARRRLRSGPRPRSSSAFPMRARPTTCAKRCRGSRAGSAITCATAHRIPSRFERHLVAMAAANISFRQNPCPSARPRRHRRRACLARRRAVAAARGPVPASVALRDPDRVRHRAADAVGQGQSAAALVPMTLQTLVVLLIGAAYGCAARRRDRARLFGRRRDRLSGVRGPGRRACAADGTDRGLSLRLRRGGLRDGLAQPSAAGIVRCCGCSSRWRSATS